MNISRYLRTVRCLKPQQIYYQFKYRVFGYEYPKAGNYHGHADDFNIFIPVLDADEKYVERLKPDGILENRIELLQESVEWKSGKWKFDDKTHLWNFNLHYFEYGVALAVKYKKTDDARYIAKLRALYKDWHNTCFEKQGGDAWHPYTISLRLKNLLIIGGIVGSGCLEQQDIYEQYRFLMENQEKHLLGNHYFENLTTIYLCSIFFREKDIQEKFEQKLEKEIKEQILPDGMHYERSFMYHNLILEDLIRLWLVSEGQFRHFLEKHIKKMTDCVYSFEEEERLPAFNDCGSNIAKRKSQLIKAAEELLEYKPIKRPLKEAGYYKLEKNGFSLIMDAGEFAPSYISGHGHCDALSIELYYKGCPVLVNSGTYQYQTDKRSYFRGTASHNTLQTIGVEQSECWGEHRTAGRIKVVEARSDGQQIMGCVEDYKGNELKRTVKLKEKVEILDSCSSPHKNYWHIHPSNTVEQIKETELKVTVSNGEILHITADQAFREINGWYSEEFGKLDRNPFFESAAKMIEINPQRGD
jgi:hypothetical protein